MGALDSPYLLEHECTGELCDFHIRYVADNVPGGCRRPVSLDYLTNSAAYSLERAGRPCPRCSPHPNYLADESYPQAADCHLYPSWTRAIVSIL